MLIRIFVALTNPRFAPCLRFEAQIAHNFLCSRPFVLPLTQRSLGLHSKLNVKAVKCQQPLCRKPRRDCRSPSISILTVQNAHYLPFLVLRASPFTYTSKIFRLGTCSISCAVIVRYHLFYDYVYSWTRLRLRLIACSENKTKK